MQQAKADLNIVRLTDKPYVALNGSAGVKNGYVPEVNQPRFNYAGGVSLKIPIYDGKTKKQIAVVESQVKQNQLAQGITECGVSKKYSTGADRYSNQY